MRHFYPWVEVSGTTPARWKKLRGGVIKPEGKRAAHVLKTKRARTRARQHMRGPRHMRHHTAQHLLTGYFVPPWLRTVSAHISGYTPSTIDLEARSVSAEDLVRRGPGEQVITENRIVKTYFVAPEEIKDIPLHKAPAVEQVRIVEIDGLTTLPGWNALPADRHGGVLKI
jgi:hypothetical protein